ncbi:MAG: threonine synthase, partial [Candidatus Krumholzibacteria bacterium]|nr:threonine synthase [Candidatus Krumholzibacteria bacterium]
MRAFEGYRCGNCEREVPAGSPVGECPACAGPLLAVYDLGLLRRRSSREELLAPRPGGIWRFRELLPALGREVTLGEGNTPLIPAPRLCAAAGGAEVLIKNEEHNPTGSFKARGIAAAVSRLLDLGARGAVMPSAGNAGIALAAYGAAAGLPVRIYVPSVTPEGFAEECAAYGAAVTVVPGILPDAARRIDEDGRGEGEHLLSTFREPCRVEGKKTMAFELEAQLEAPADWIVFPTGGGTGVVALWKAYEELEELGWLAGPIPRIAAVQAAGCAPVVRAVERGADRMEPWPDPDTIAPGIRVPGSRADRQILRAIYRTGGTAVAVDDGEIVEAARS